MGKMGNAPGLSRRQRSDGTYVCYWVAARVSQQAAAYPLRTMRLEGGPAEIAAQCRLLTAELRVWLADRDKAEPEYNGTLGSLIAVYQTDEDSPYRGVKSNTRHHYDHTLGLLGGIGGARIAMLTRKNFARWHRGFRFPKGEDGPDRVRRAHNCMKVLRIVIRFGASMRFAGCRDAADVLSNMAFQQPAPRRSAMTYAQAAAIIDKAIAEGRPSIALAQALQFELSLRQRDVIGEWENVNDGPDCNTDRSGVGASSRRFALRHRNAADPIGGGVVYHGQRWANGVLWSDLSPDLILTKQTTKTAAVGEWDLKLYPLVMRALTSVPSFCAPPQNGVTHRLGPMIVSETSGYPYRHRQFARLWRQIARAAGVPDDVWNMDSRAGGITEGADAGANVDDLRRHATHTNSAMTSRYIRGTGPATARVATLRVAKRTKNET